MSGDDAKKTEQADVDDPSSGDCAAGTMQDTQHKVEPGKKEIGGRDGPDPTRYGDWEKNGRCIDF